MMSILKDLQESQGIAQLHGKTAKQIEQAFLANYVASLVVLRTGDIGGLMTIRPTGNIDRFSPRMSPAEFWAHIVFKATPAQLKRNLKQGVIDELQADSGRVLDRRLKKMMDVLSKPTEQTNWLDVVYSLKLMQVRFEISFPTLNTIASALYTWPNAGTGARGNAIGQALRFLQMSDPTSALIPVIRDMSSTTQSFSAVTSGIIVGTTFRKFLKLKEDGVGGADGGGGTDAQAGTEASMAGSIGIYPKMIFKDGKIVRRKQRKFKVRRWKDPTRNAELGDWSNVKVN